MSDDFFKPKSDLEMEPVRGRAAIRSNVFPDIVNAELPLDNQRAPGYRRIQPTFSGFIQDAGTGGFISQYPSGRYSKAHFHASGAVLVCLRGKGYTYNWPVEAGPTPWLTGKADQVRVLEYVPGGLVAAAPGGGNWFHQHFGIGDDPLRVINYWGGPHSRWGIAEERDDDVKAGNLFGIHEGGRTILYHEEDTFIRDEYRRRLSHEGLLFSRLELERQDNRYVTVRRDVLYQSDILFTPYRGGTTIDQDALGAFIGAQYTRAGIERSAVD